MADHVNESLNRILRSGEYVCRPQRQIFVEHTFTNKQGEVTRKVTKDDLLAIAATGNANATTTGDLAPIGFGHTFDDIMDENGALVRKFSEAEQPKPIGYLHNYTVRQRSDGKFALYADEWIQRVINDERGTPVDGIKYAETFPRRSAEYFPGKKWIDWLALLRRTPALNMGLDIYAFAMLHPDKVHYSGGHFGAVVDSRGKWRYAHEEDSMDPTPGAPSPGTPPDAAPPAAPPTAPADDRPPMPAQTSDQLPPEHQEAAKRYAMHCTGMHPSQHKALLHHAHAMYSAQLGLPGDKMAEHVPPPAPAAPPAPGAPAAVAPPGPPAAAPAAATPPPAVAPPAPDAGGPPKPPEHEKHNAPVAGPGVGPAFIPGSQEHNRMSAVQAGIEQHITADRYQELAQKVNALELDKARALYERDLVPLSYRYQFDLSVEVERMARFHFERAACDEQISTIKACYREREHPPTGGSFIEPIDAPGINGPEKKVTYEESQKAKKYAAKNNVDFDEALAKIRGV